MNADRTVRPHAGWWWCPPGRGKELRVEQLGQGLVLIRPSLRPDAPHCRSCLAELLATSDLPRRAR